jgi:ribonuclease HI
MAWYAVYRGRVPGVYNLWRRCEDQVDGYTSNSYKRFNTREKAEED